MAVSDRLHLDLVAETIAETYRKGRQREAADALWSFGAGRITPGKRWGCIRVARLTLMAAERLTAGELKGLTMELELLADTRANE